MLLLLLLLLPKYLLSFSSFMPNLGLLFSTRWMPPIKNVNKCSYHNKLPPYYCCIEFFILDWYFPFAIPFREVDLSIFICCKHKVRLQFVSCQSQSLQQSHRHQACPFNVFEIATVVDPHHLKVLANFKAQVFAKLARQTMDNAVSVSRCFVSATQ